MQKSRLRDRKLGIKPTTKPKKKSHLKFVLLFVLLFIVLITGAYLLMPKSWDGKSKIAIGVGRQDGIATVIILDPSSSRITTIEIPKETAVSAAHQLGTWKMGSILNLERDENFDGSFFKNTIIKTFEFPIDGWGEEPYINLISGNILKEIDAITAPESSNFSFIDKIRIAWFSLTIGTSGRNDINLSDTSYLERAKLPDATLGWVVNGTIPTNLQALFVNETIQNSNLNIAINNASGDNGQIDIIEKPIETLGANIVSIQNLSQENINCKVTGLSQIAVEKIANMFSCEVSFQKNNNNFDIIVDIGTKFKERF